MEVVKFLEDNPNLTVGECMEQYANEKVAERMNKIGCCMACRYWRDTQGKKGECMKIDKSVFTDEGHYCKDYSEGVYA